MKTKWGIHLFKLRKILLLFGLFFAACKNVRYEEVLIDKEYKNLASVFISNKLHCILFHFDPGGAHGGSFRLITCDTNTSGYEMLAIRDIEVSMPTVDSIVNEGIYVHYNFESEKKVNTGILEDTDVLLGPHQKLSHNYFFVNQSNYCGNQLQKTVYFDSVNIQLPDVFFYSNHKVVEIQQLNNLQFPYKKNVIEYLRMDGCKEAYTILEPRKNMQIDEF